MNLKQYRKRLLGCYVCEGMIFSCLLSAVWLFLCSFVFGSTYLYEMIEDCAFFVGGAMILGLLVGFFSYHRFVSFVTEQADKESICTDSFTGQDGNVAFGKNWIIVKTGFHYLPYYRDSLSDERIEKNMTYFLYKKHSMVKIPHASEKSAERIDVWFHGKSEKHLNFEA